MPRRSDLNSAIAHLKRMERKKRNWQMPGDGRYQPDELKSFLGYDQWVGWLIVVEWFWMVALAKIGVMPKADAKLLTLKRLLTLLSRITTTMQDKVEKETRHDIIALLVLMRKYLPKRLHRWLHFGVTSYDIICTAYALQFKMTFQMVFWPKLRQVDDLWRRRILETAEIVQAGRTHLQTALPVTVGFWLGCLHNRFANTARKSLELANQIEGKFSGAVGTSAAQVALFRSRRAEKVVMEILGLRIAKQSTQIAPPESMARFYFELVLLSGVSANLGEDVRILQSSQFGEIISLGSSSSAMPHKTANPILAENIAGMHITIVAEFFKIPGTLVSDLQRDLRWSSVMRSFSAIMVYAYQQLLTTERLLRTLGVNQERCRQNFDIAGKLVVAELLHLALQKQGVANTHHLVNKIIVPQAAKTRLDLTQVMEDYLETNPDIRLQKTWNKIPLKIKKLLQHPEQYTGMATANALLETLNKL